MDPLKLNPDRIYTKAFLHLFQAVFFRRWHTKMVIFEEISVIVLLSKLLLLLLLLERVD